MLRITRDKLKEMLARAYESGWGGCPELKEEYVELVLDGFDGLDDSSGTSDLTVSLNPVSVTTTYDLVPPHYSYCGYSLPVGTVLVNDPEEEI